MQELHAAPTIEFLVPLDSPREVQVARIQPPIQFPQRGWPGAPGHRSRPACLCSRRTAQEDEVDWGIRLHHFLVLIACFLAKERERRRDCVDAASVCERKRRERASEAANENERERPPLLSITVACLSILRRTRGSPLFQQLSLSRCDSAAP